MVSRTFSTAKSSDTKNSGDICVFCDGIILKMVMPGLWLLSGEIMVIRLAKECIGHSMFTINTQAEQRFTSRVAVALQTYSIFHRRCYSHLQILHSGHQTSVVSHFEHLVDHTINQMLKWLFIYSVIIIIGA